MQIGVKWRSIIPLKRHSNEKEEVKIDYSPKQIEIGLLYDTVKKGGSDGVFNYLTCHSVVVLNILTFRVILLLYSSSNTICMVLSENFENYIFFNKNKDKSTNNLKFSVQTYRKFWNFGGDM